MPFSLPFVNMPDVVIKRDGREEPVDKTKILIRLQRLKVDVEKFYQRELRIDVAYLADLVQNNIYNRITTSELDEIAADISGNCTLHPDYSLFGGNILVSNTEANNRQHSSFRAFAIKAYKNIHPKTGEHTPLISEQLYRIALKFGHLIDRKICTARNFLYDYAAMCTLIQGKYLLIEHKTRVKNAKEVEAPVTFETPQQFHMRIALGLHGFDLDSAFELYDVFSLQKANMATPTMFNAGTPRPSMSSCFLLGIEDDIDGIYDTLKRCAKISKGAGGIGVHVHDIRCAGSHIKGTNGISNGLVPMSRVFNATARYVDQGGGKRKGAIALYVEPWHGDIEEFLQLKWKDGHEEERSRDLYYALWMPDLFFERLKQACENPDDEKCALWSLMDPKIARDLPDLYGEAFKRRYEEYEAEGKYVRQVNIRDLWALVLKSCVETGTPYILSKNACNEKSNQKNLGTIRSSNLCAEIIQYSTSTQEAVCNLCSINLKAFARRDTQDFDFDEMQRVVKIMIRALNCVIDRNYYPTLSSRKNNLQNRPVGLGIQGLANAFSKMRLAFDSPQAAKLNKRMAEVVYFAALTASKELAQKHGPYPSMNTNGGAPISKGIFQQDMWPADAGRPDDELALDWEGLRAEIVTHGVRNSLLIAHMPTASTSLIMGNVECFEPHFGNTTVRSTKIGEFFKYNVELVEDLEEAGLWNVEMDKAGRRSVALRDAMIQNQGSIQKIEAIPQSIRDTHKTILDMKMSSILNMALARAPFVDQSMSHNIYYRNKDNMLKRMTQVLLYLWAKGAKTLVYYTRTVQDSKLLKYTLDEINAMEDAHLVSRGTQEPVKRTFECTDEVCVSCTA